MKTEFSNHPQLADYKFLSLRLMLLTDNANGDAYPAVERFLFQFHFGSTSLPAELLCLPSPVQLGCFQTAVKTNVRGDVVPPDTSRQPLEGALSMNDDRHEEG